MAKVTLIGSLTKDIIRLEGESTSALGGSIYYAGEAFNSFDHKVTLIPLFSRENNSFLRDINRNILVKPIYVENTFLFENIYQAKDVFSRKQKILKRDFQRQGISTAHIPEHHIKTADMIFLGPQSPFDIPSSVIKHIYSLNKNICLYAQGFFRSFYEMEIKEKSWKEAGDYLKLVKVLILSEKHLQALFKKNTIHESLIEIAKIGPSEIIVSRGENGFLIYSDGKFVPVAFPFIEGTINPNGLTSTFSAVYLSERLNRETANNAAQYAIHAAFVKINSWDPLKQDRKRIEEIMAVRKFLRSS